MRLLRGPEFVVKLVCEIADDQKNRTRDQTFEGDPDPNRLPVPVVQPCPYLVLFWPNYAKSPQHAQNPNIGVLLVASGLMNSYIMKFNQDWTKIFGNMQQI